MEDRKMTTSHDEFLKHPVFSFLRWLLNKPSGDQMARELVINFFDTYGACQARIANMDDEGNLFFVGDFGFEKTLTGTNQTIHEIKTRTDEIARINIGPDGYGWSDSGKYLQIRIDDCGHARTWLTLGFAAPVKDKEDATALCRILALPLGNYACFNLMPNRQFISSNRSNASRSDFSQRQLQILQGMVEGKTNHELASDLGFSVSTIRHETMRIYQSLGVSDRREAAREALDRDIF